MRGPFVLLVTKRDRAPSSASPRNSHNFFTLFVDVIFTTLLEPLFTNAPDVIGAKPVKDCVCRARHAD
jgi:hypothetical protein